MTETSAWNSPDWSQLAHAYGPATDAPIHLDNLLSTEQAKQEAALEYLLGAVLHQGTTYSATAPAALAVSRLLADPRTLRPVSHWTDLEQPPRLLRESLLDFLAAVAESTTYEPSGASFETLAGRQDQDVEAAVANMWRGDFNVEGSDQVRVRAADVYTARAVLQSRQALSEIAPRVLVHLTAPDPRVRQSAANAAAKFAEALHDKAFAASVLSTLETTALNADARERASLVLSIGELGGMPNRFLEDQEFVVRCCAALAPALAGDPKATRLVLEAMARPHEIDQFTDGLPQFEMRARFTFVKVGTERAASFEDLLPGALAIAAVGSAYTVEGEIGPLLLRAFPEPYSHRQPLSPSQRAFLQALVNNEAVWSKVLGNPKPWFKRVGLPYDRDACRTTLA